MSATSVVDGVTIDAASSASPVRKQAWSDGDSAPAAAAEMGCNTSTSAGNLTGVVPGASGVTTAEVGAMSDRSFITPEVAAALKTLEFNMFEFSRDQLLMLIAHMFHDLGFCTQFDIADTVLNWFLKAVQRTYRPVQYHNFQHCFMVAQLCYVMIVEGRTLPTFITLEEQFVMMSAAVCHDLDHPGLNNAYQINAKTDLAIMYNDRTVLENHHAATAFRLLSEPSCNIFKNIPPATMKTIRNDMIECILATDMAKHFQLVEGFDAMAASFSWDNKKHRLYLIQMMICVADISNEMRPWVVAKPWADYILEEFFAQTDREKVEGLPTMTFMDRAFVVQEHSSVNFIRGILRPQVVALAKVVPWGARWVTLIDERIAKWTAMLHARNIKLILNLMVKDAEGKGGLKTNKYEAGDVIVRKGEASSHMFFISKGKVSVVSEDLAKVFDTMVEGDFFGEIASFFNTPRTATIIAAVPTEIFVVTSNEVTDLLARYPEHATMFRSVADERMGMVHKRETAEIHPEQLVELGG